MVVMSIQALIAASSEARSKITKIVICDDQFQQYIGETDLSQQFFVAVAECKN